MFGDDFWKMFEWLVYAAVALCVIGLGAIGYLVYRVVTALT